MSGFSNVMVKTSGGLVLPAGVGEVNSNPAINVQATDANSVITAASIVGRLYFRTGMTAGRTDTTDTAVNILAAMPGMGVGDSFTCVFSVQPAFALTITAGAGITNQGTKGSIPASGVATVLFTKTSSTTMDMRIL